MSKTKPKKPNGRPRNKTPNNISTTLRCTVDEAASWDAAATAEGLCLGIGALSRGTWLRMLANVACGHAVHATSATTIAAQTKVAPSAPRAAGPDEPQPLGKIAISAEERSALLQLSAGEEVGGTVAIGLRKKGLVDSEGTITDRGLEVVMQ